MSYMSWRYLAASFLQSTFDPSLDESIPAAHAYKLINFAIVANLHTVQLPYSMRLLGAYDTYG
jgi:hypothetical protein